VKYGKTHNLISEEKRENVSLAMCWIRFIDRSLQHVAQWTTCMISHYNGL